MIQSRIRIIGLVCTISLLIVLTRVTYLQLGLGMYHAVQRAQPQIRVREIPALRGTIRAGDGTILAQDRCDADLAVHFRYLQQPTDRQWLESQARARLTRVERRDSERVEQEQAAIQQEIALMWRSLADLAGRDESVLRARAVAIQARVERVVQAVESRRRARDAERPTRPPQPTTEPPSLWRLVWERLGEPEPRPAPAPLAIPEQARFYPLVENMTVDSLLAFAAQPERFPGVRLESRVRRSYPQKELASAVIGYVEPESGGPAANDAAPDTSLIGVSGIEGFYDDPLRGRMGWVRERIGPRGGPPQVLGGRVPSAGRDLTLTLDLRLQLAAEQLLDSVPKRRLEPATDSGVAPGASSGVILVMDVRDGGLRVAATAPRFDPNIAAQPGSAAWQALAGRADTPLFNRIAQMSLPPGSAFKPLAAIAALENRLDPGESYYCQGYLHQPDQFRCLIFRHHGVGHEQVTLATAMSRSCNVFFFRQAERLGWRPLVYWAEAFGFGRPTGIDLAGESAGFVPTPDRVVDRYRRGWEPADPLGLAIGQSSLVVSPVQIAVLMAAIANDGLLVTPHLRQDGFEPPRTIVGLSRDTLATVRSALTNVVTDPRGTGHAVLSACSVPIAGKTGTAQSGSAKGDHAWFAGYLPADDPRWVVVVALEHGGSGGDAAAPLVRELVEQMVRFGDLQAPAPRVAAQPGLQTR
jgi:penicillin-binding protein 2